MAVEVALLVLFLVGALSFRRLHKWGIVLGSIAAIGAFIKLLGL
jgi:hypothetical protein